MRQAKLKVFSSCFVLIEFAVEKTHHKMQLTRKGDLRLSGYIIRKSRFILRKSGEP